jgi:hypothetical protein
MFFRLPARIFLLVCRELPKPPMKEFNNIDPLPTVSHETMLAELRMRQNLPVAVLAGCGAALLGAVIWAVITSVTGYQIGWMAVGVGFLVGFGVRLGKGIDRIYNIIGAALALAGCVAGNIFTVMSIASNMLGVGFWDVGMDFALEVMKATFSPMDLLFYGIAIYEGWRFSTKDPEIA